MFEDAGCKLLSNYYINPLQKLDYQCSCGNISKIKLNSFIYGSRCANCAQEKRNAALRKPYSEVKAGFENMGYALLTAEQDYHGSSQKLEYICSCGTHSYITWDQVRKGSGCNNCKRVKIGNAQRYDRNKIIDYMNKTDYELIDVYIENQKTFMIIKCPNGHQYKTTPSLFIGTQYRCHKCETSGRLGEKHPLWNPNLTEEERFKGRQISGYSQWKRKVLENGNYTCTVCSKTKNDGVKICVHHLNNYKDFPEQIMDEDNGTTICRKCHLAFQNIYGTRNTTKEMFNEFLIKVKDGEINIDDI